jgi:hypothetical protein
MSLGLLHQVTKAMPSSQNCGRDGSPSLLPRHIKWIDVVDVRAQSPLLMSGALPGLDCKNAEAPSMPHTIPGMGSEPWIRFSPMV